MSRNIIDCITQQNIESIFNIFNTLNIDDSHKLEMGILVRMLCLKPI